TGGVVVLDRFGVRDYRKVVSLWIVVSVVLAGLTLARNRVWKDELTLWTDVVKKSPNKARALNNFASYYGEMGLYDKALEYLFKSNAIDPKDPFTLNNIALCFFYKGDLQRAIDYASQATLVAPNFYQAYNTLGQIYLSMGLCKRAVDYFLKALDLYKEEAKIYYNVSLSYLCLNNIERAEHFFELFKNYTEDKNLLKTLEADFQRRLYIKKQMKVK
ncbi:MAG: hypothetical protein D6710_07585, partial [Nitrospirae bacterium]